MPIYEYTPDKLEEVSVTRFNDVGIREREDLQRLLRDQIEIIEPDLLVISEEFSEWDESRRRIDLLAIDAAANLVVIELKRTEDGGHMELQALRYAAMVSTMTFSRAVTVYAAYLSRRGLDLDAESSLIDFLGWDEPNEDDFAPDVRIILVSADFSRELTTSVMWLAERDIDIRCVRVKPYQRGEQILIDVQQIIPLPEAQEYQIRVREKASQERAARQGEGEREQRHLRFWSQLLAKANARSPLHQNVSPPRGNWIGTTNYGLGFNYVLARQRGRVEIYIGRTDRDENKSIFAELESHKAAIEKAFGGELSWQQLGQKTASRIAAFANSGSTGDESTWDTLQTEMVDQMIRLEAALAPYIAKYRQGEKPRLDTGRVDARKAAHQETR
ncbi:MAG: DUF4268 domain-containing protein [Planctomycetes bacterium]|nr:DUF4268 domain-containing protein [Planctomycetota bacterium]